MHRWLPGHRRGRYAWTAMSVSTALLLGGADTAWTGVGVWTARGPEGGYVTALAIDPAQPLTVYAGTRGSGMFKSLNGGGSWSVLSFPSIARVRLVAVDPVNPAAVYAVTDDGDEKLLKSNDSGRSWTEVTIPELGIDTLFIARGTPAVLYAAASHIDPFGYFRSGSIYKSTDGGASWTTINPVPLNGFMVNELLAIDPVTPTTLYARESQDLYRSTDAGGTWTAIGTLPSVLALAVDPLTPTTLFGVGNGVYKSTDGGRTWATINPDPPVPMVESLAIDPVAPGILYVRGGDAGSGEVAKSSDGGATWRLIAFPLPTDISALAIDPATPATLYAAGSGVFKSADGGATWTAINAGLTAIPVHALAGVPGTSAVLYAGTGSGLFRSTDGGLAWNSVDTGAQASSPGGGVDVTAMAVDPVSPGTVYAATDAGVQKTTDGGATWTTGTGPTQGARALAIDPRTPTTVYAAAGGVSKSTDGGATWISVPGYYLSGVQALVIDPAMPATVYAGTYCTLWMTTDGGATWTATTSPPDCGDDVQALAIDPAMPATVYAGTSSAVRPGGVLKSTNGGTTWGAVNSGLPDPTTLAVQTLAIDPHAPATIYAGTAGSGVFRTTDGGAHWSALNSGLTNLHVRALVVDPAKPTALYAATAAGVFAFEFCTTTRCTLDAGLSAMCAGQDLPARVTRKLDRASSLIDRAAEKSGKQARRLLRRAKKILRRAKATAKRAAKGRTPKLTGDCAAAIATAVDQVVRGLGL